MRLIAVLAPVFAVALSACAGIGNEGPGAGAPGAATERARLRLTDQCMYEAARTAGAKDNTGPRCQCYARGALRQMSSSDVASVAAGGSVPFSVRGPEIMSACAARSNAFAEAAPRRQGKRKAAPSAAPSADAPASSEPAASPAAAPPAAPAGEAPAEAPKSE